MRTFSLCSVSLDSRGYEALGEEEGGNDVVQKATSGDSFLFSFAFFSLVSTAVSRYRCM